MSLKKLLNVGFIAHSRVILGVLLVIFVMGLMGCEVSQGLWALALFNVALWLSLWLPLAKHIPFGYDGGSKEDQNDRTNGKCKALNLQE